MPLIDESNVGNYSLPVPPPHAKTFLTVERAVLIEIYRACYGADIGIVGNWSSSKPVGNWAGVTTNDKGRVIGIDLSNNSIKGTIPQSIGKLSCLQTLDLHGNNFSGSLDFLSDLSELKELFLQENKFNGNIPPSLTCLQKLEELDLSENKLCGPIPENISNLSELTVLDLSENELTGEIPDSICDMPLLEGLSLNDNKLTGHIPQQMGNLIPSSEGIWLEFFQRNGQDRAGDIFPDHMPNLLSLSLLSLQNNKFSGEIPINIGNLSQLTVLEANNNKLTGKIPDSICDMVLLEELRLNDNKLTGELPGLMGNLTALVELEFNNNLITGSFPSSMAGCSLQLLTGFAGNSGFNGRSKPWQHKLTNTANPSEVSSKWQVTTIVIGALLAYVDVISDCIAAIVVYDSNQYGYFGLQIFFFVFPAVYLAMTTPGQTFIQRACTVFQLRLAIETFSSIMGKAETPMFVSLKFLESIVEAVPSSMLQLTVVLTSSDPLNSNSSLFLLISFLISMCSVSMTLHKIFPVHEEHDKDSPSGMNTPDDPSTIFSDEPVQRPGGTDSLLFIFHLAEVLFRVATFVAVFASVGGYGFILLGLSVFFRFGLSAMSSLHEEEDRFALSFRLILSQSFIGTVSESMWDAKYFQNAQKNKRFDDGFNPFYCVHILSVIDCFIAFLILFTVPDSPVSVSRQMDLLMVALVAFGIKMIYYKDRSGKFYLNKIFFSSEMCVKILFIHICEECLCDIFSCCRSDDDFLSDIGDDEDIANEEEGSGKGKGKGLTMATRPPSSLARNIRHLKKSDRRSDEISEEDDEEGDDDDDDDDDDEENEEDGEDGEDDDEDDDDDDDGDCDDNYDDDYDDYYDDIDEDGDDDSDDSPV